MTIKQWVRIGKMFGNENRLRILKLLFDGSEKTVTELAQGLKISLVAASRHLVLLEGQGLLEATGKNNHVFYRISNNMIKDIRRVLDIIVCNV